MPFDDEKTLKALLKLPNQKAFYKSIETRLNHLEPELQMPPVGYELTKSEKTNPAHQAARARFLESARPKF